MDFNGYSYKAEGGVLRVTRGSLVVMKGIKENGLYILQGHTVLGVVATAFGSDIQKAQLWHQRLAHVSERGLQELEKQGLLCEDKLGKLEFCEHCIYGKASRLKFNKAVHITKGILNYVH